MWILLLKKDENYFLSVFLKKCKYIEKIVIRHNIEEKEFFSSDYDEE